MERHRIYKIGIVVLIALTMGISYAGSPVWTFTPDANFPPAVTVGKTNTATIQYTVTNQSRRTHQLIMRPIKGITSSGCTSPLTYHQSCTLTLQVNGNELSGSVVGGPILCSQGNPNQCYQPSEGNELKIKLAEITGKVQSGIANNVIFINNASVTVYAAGPNGSEIVGSAVTNINGEFFIALSPRTLKTYKGYTFFVIARKGNDLVLANVIGTQIVPTLIVNELTTVATAYAMAQFLDPSKLLLESSLIKGSLKGLNIASQMNHNLVDPMTGSFSAVVASPPNAFETNAQRSLGSLANLLLPCVRNGGSDCTFLYNETAFNGSKPSNVLAAIYNIARHPSNNVSGIFNLAQITTVYTPSLTIPAFPSPDFQSEPDAWTIAIKFNHSGNDTSCPFGGPGGMVQDKNGFIWITNNTIQGTPDSSNCMIVLKSNGAPADGKNWTPNSPIFGGGLLGGGLGICIAADETIWQGNFGWGSCSTCIPNGSASQFTPLGHPISGPDGYQSASPNELDRVQGIISDRHNNIWMANVANNKVVVFRKGLSNDAISYQEPDMSYPFGIAIDNKERVWVTNNGSVQLPEDSSSNPGSVYVYKLTESGIELLKIISPVGLRLKEIAVDSIGNIWVASTVDNTLPVSSSVYQIDGDNYNIIGNYTGGGIAGPWGLAIDGNDHIWVGNFESQPLGSQPFKARVSELCGNQPATCPPGSTTPGDGISPNTGYTLPSGGTQVLLPNGDPLRGKNQPPTFSPLMRQTYVLIDPAGNVWVTNNWKPIPITDGQLNPGGDGLVAFVGMAKPKDT